MKIVIDIPQIMYGAIKQYGITFLSCDDKKILRKSIANGTPLPKGHGRIIDESKIEVCEWVDVLEEGYPKASTDAPTIIEADKEGENEANN